MVYNQTNEGFPRGCNQGIRIASGENILLLNNDVIVTEHWLDNLLAALYSSDDIGAVGPVSNSVSYYQSIPVSYKTIEEMQIFASAYNAQPLSTDFRVRLIGFCMLIRRKIIDNIGFLDERFSPGNFEDDDYSMRILSAGYQLLLSKNTFVHHFGSSSFKKDEFLFNELLETNRLKFIDKWGFDSHDSTKIHFELIDLIKSNQEQIIHVLDLNCGCGATLLEIKTRFPKAQIYGISSSNAVDSIAQKFVNIYSGCIEDINEGESTVYFDYIIAADVFSYVLDLNDLLKKLSRKLKKHGSILLSAPNISHYFVIKNLLHGRWPYSNANIYGKQIRFFTAYDLQNLLESVGFSISSFQGTKLQLTQEDEFLLYQLQNLGQAGVSEQISVYQFQIKAELTNKDQG